MKNRIAYSGVMVAFLCTVSPIMSQDWKKDPLVWATLTGGITSILIVNAYTLRTMALEERQALQQEYLTDFSEVNNPGDYYAIRSSFHTNLKLAALSGVACIGSLVWWGISSRKK